MFPLQAGRCTCSEDSREREAAPSVEPVSASTPRRDPSGRHRESIRIDFGVQNAHSTPTSVDAASSIPNHAKVLSKVTPLLDVLLCKKAPNLVRPSPGLVPLARLHSLHHPRPMFVNPHPGLVVPPLQEPTGRCPLSPAFCSSSLPSRNRNTRPQRTANSILCVTRTLVNGCSRCNL